MWPSHQKSQACNKAATSVSISRVWKWGDRQKDRRYWSLPMRASILLTEVPFSKLLNLYPLQGCSWAWPLTSLWILLCLFFLLLWGSTECQDKNAFIQHMECSWGSYTNKKIYVTKSNVTGSKESKKRTTKEVLTNQETQYSIPGDYVYTGQI